MRDAVYPPTPRFIIRRSCTGLIFVPTIVEPKRAIRVFRYKKQISVNFIFEANISREKVASVTTCVGQTLHVSVPGILTSWGVSADDYKRRSKSSKGPGVVLKDSSPIVVTAFAKVFMLSGDLDRHLSKPRFRQLFDRVHMSLTAVDVAGNPAINTALADQAVVTMDTGR